MAILILYKYFPCNEYTYKSLAIRGLWCHHAKEMNDPLECLSAIERKINNTALTKFKEAASKSKNNLLQRLSVANTDVINRLLTSTRNKYIELYAFCSLSERCDDILMWAHYANSHKGVVIGFEFDTAELGVHLQKVRYVNSLPDWDMQKYLEFMEGNDDHHGIFLSDLSVKSQHWEREAEYRIWRSGPGYFKFRDEQVKEIYFGVNCDLETKKVVLELLNFLPREFLIQEMTVNKETLDLTW